MARYNKFWVAVVILGGNAVRSRYGLELGIDDQLASDLVSGLTAAFVYLVPNKGA